MLARTLAIAACGLLGLTACETFNEPLAQAPATEAAIPRGLSELHIAVRRPQEGDAVSDFERVHRPGLPAELRQEWREDAAEHVVDTLVATELFASVAYRDEVLAEPMLVIDPLISPPGGYCDGQDVFIVMLTLGIFPASCTADQGVYFKVVGRALPTVACPWPRTIMAGWFPGLVAMQFGDWTRKPNEVAFHRHMRQCLVSQHAAFLTSHPPPKPPAAQQAVEPDVE